MDYIVGIVVTMIEIISCTIFFEALGKRKSDNQVHNFIFIVLLFLFAHLFSSLLYDKFVIKELVIILGTAGLMRLHINEKLYRLLIESFLFQGLLLSIDYLALWSIVTFFESIEHICEEHYIGGCLVTIITKILLFMIVIVIQKEFGSNRSFRLRRKDLLRLAIFPIFTIGSVISILCSSGNIENQNQENVFLGIALSMTIMNVIVFYIMQDIIKGEEKIHEGELYRLQVKNQMDMYRTISDNNKKQRKQAHEFKNHLLCITELGLRYRNQ